MVTVPKQIRSRSVTHANRARLHCNSEIVKMKQDLFASWSDLTWVMLKSESLPGKFKADLGGPEVNLASSVAACLRLNGNSVCPPILTAIWLTSFVWGLNVKTYGRAKTPFCDAQRPSNVKSCSSDAEGACLYGDSRICQDLKPWQMRMPHLPQGALRPCATQSQVGDLYCRSSNGPSAAKQPRVDIQCSLS